MSIDEKMLIIRRNDFLAQLSREDYDVLNVVHNYIVADKNDYIYFDPQSHNKLYFVKEGYVKIGHVDDDGTEFIKDILQPGDVFGQFALERNNMSGEFAQAYKVETILCAFTVQDFERLLLQRPLLAVSYAKKIGSTMKRIDNRLLNLLQKDVRTRVLYFFWTLLQQKNDGHVNTWSIPNYFTHEDIARLTGTTRQTVTTLISQFSAEGILDMDRKTISIYNVKLLQKQAKVG